jgi:outer membrane immunogenic protein
MASQISGAIMKKLFLASIALFAFNAGNSALAADLRVKAPVYKAPSPVQVYSWTGFYVGANGGYGWRGRTVTFAGDNDLVGLVPGLIGIALPGSAAFDVRGGFGGVQLGYNWQIAQSWLVGLEADFDGSHIAGSGAGFGTIQIPAPIPPTIATVTADQNLKWFGTVRGRLGLLLTNNLLVYATGGLAYGRVTEAVSLVASSNIAIGGLTGFGCVVGSPCFAGSSARTVGGWTAGGGFEFALWDRVSVKGEYLLLHLGHGDTVTAVATATPLSLAPSTFTAAHSDLNVHIVRVGLNYRFDWGKAPVAVLAKY